jgi:hypothetical protein
VWHVSFLLVLCRLTLRVVVVAAAAVVAVAAVVVVVVGGMTMAVGGTTTTGRGGTATLNGALIPRLVRAKQLFSGCWSW